MPAETQQQGPLKTVDQVEEIEYKFAKYNLQVKPPPYNPSQYDTLLKSDNWSKEETEYLLELHSDFYGKWPVIYDRYDYRPAVHDTSLKPAGEIQIFSERSMEDMKARFYEVSAKLMAAQTPVSNMTASEFEDHEKMTKFDPKQETERKRQKEALLARTKDEKKEEEYLLAELRRIYMRQKRNEEEQADLRERLDHSLTDSVPGAPSYNTSTEINNLFQKMLTKDKNQKAQRRSIFGDAGGPNATPTSAAAAGPPQSATSAQAGGPKRASMAAGTTPTRRQIPPVAEKRFGITHHDRLTSGVTFRSDKLTKARVAKSAAQTQKIATILGELQIPEILQMPTSNVVQGMEKLVAKVSLLIEARRAKEKEQNDLKVAKQLKGLRSESEAKQDDKERAEAAEKKDGDGDVTMGDDETKVEPSGDVNGDAEAEGDNRNNGEGEAEADEENQDDEGAGEDGEEEDEDQEEGEDSDVEGETQVEGDTQLETAADSDVDGEEEAEEENEEEVEEEEGDDGSGDGEDGDEDEEVEEEEEEQSDAEDGAEVEGETELTGAATNEDDGEEQEEDEDEDEDGEDEDKEQDDDEEQEEEDEAEAVVESPPEPPARRNTKRSVSVMSAASSAASRKRQKG